MARGSSGQTGRYGEPYWDHKPTWVAGYVSHCVSDEMVPPVVQAIGETLASVDAAPGPRDEARRRAEGA